MGTLADELMPAVEEVALLDLKWRDGSAVTVLCEPLSELDVAEAYGQLPGGNPAITRAEKDAAKNAAANPKAMAEGARVIEASIVLGCALKRDDGFQKPAFWAGDPVEGCFPVKSLTIRDRSLLRAAVWRVSGLETENAKAANFRDEEQRGGEDSVRDMGAGEGDGESPARSTGTEAGGPGMAGQASAGEVAASEAAASPAGSDGD